MSKHVGMLHPGEMGALVGAAAVSSGTRVSWASAGRSDSTARRASAAGLSDLHTLKALANECDVIISVCPPEAALTLAHSVADERFSGIFVDANAISRASAAQVAAIVRAGGASFVDGGIIGPPPQRPGSTRLYLSGEAAEEITVLFAGSALEAISIGADPGAASALKMCYAAWTKGSAALLTAVRALAEAEGVGDSLVNEWNLSQQGLAQRSEAVAGNNAFKAWRWEGEMREIAASFAACNLPPGFHEASKEIYARQRNYKDSTEAPALADVIDVLLEARQHDA